MRNQIITEAEEYKKSFYEKREKTIETNKTDNREKEKVSSDKIHNRSHLRFLGVLETCVIFASLAAILG